MQSYLTLLCNNCYDSCTGKHCHSLGTTSIKKLTARQRWDQGEKNNSLPLVPSLKPSFQNHAWYNKSSKRIKIWYSHDSTTCKQGNLTMMIASNKRVNLAKEHMFTSFNVKKTSILQGLTILKIQYTSRKRSPKILTHVAFNISRLEGIRQNWPHKNSVSIEI